MAGAHVQTGFLVHITSPPQSSEWDSQGTHLTSQLRVRGFAALNSDPQSRRCPVDLGRQTWPHLPRTHLEQKQSTSHLGGTLLPDPRPSPWHPGLSTLGSSHCTHCTFKLPQRGLMSRGCSSSLSYQLRKPFLLFC